MLRPSGGTPRSASIRSIRRAGSSRSRTKSISPFTSSDTGSSRRIPAAALPTRNASHSEMNSVSSRFAAIYPRPRDGFGSGKR